MLRKVTTALVALAHLLFGAFAVAHQAGGPGAQVECEVASVRLVEGRNVPRAVAFNAQHGRFSVEATTLKQITAFAYGIQNSMVQGGPD